jgi:hypothetical protein
MAFLLWGKTALFGLNDVKKIQRDNHNERDSEQPQENGHDLFLTGKTGVA